MSKFLPLPLRARRDPVIHQRVMAFDAWDEAHRKARPFAGLKFCYGSWRHFTLASRHWPHLLCWQWLLSLDILPYRPRFFHWHQSGPGAHGGLTWMLRLGWLFCLTYKRQASDRIANLGPRYADAPVIYPRDEYEVRDCA